MCELTNHHIEDLKSMGNRMDHYNHHPSQHLQQGSISLPHLQDRLQ